MVTILSVICIFLAMSLFVGLKYDDYKLKKDKVNYIYPILICVVAFSIRLICAFQFSGHGYDTSCFRAWASRLGNDGFAAFYSSDQFNNYPPGYMYVLWVIGKLNNVFHYPSDAVFNIVLKIPAIVVDILGGVFVYKIARKKFSENISLIIMAFWLFNPAVITDSSLWGQVDVIYTVAIAVMIYFITEKKLIYSYFIFALCILLKPQSFIITPVLIYGIIEQVFLDGFDKKNFLENLIWGCVAILAMFVVVMPYGVQYVFEQYKETLKGSEYIVQNAFNFWAAIGKNYNHITTWASVMGYIFIAAAVAFSAMVCFKSKSKGKYYLTGAILILCSYMLSVKMNERYAFCAILLFLIYFIETPNKETAAIYGLISCSQFYNIAWILFIFEQDFYKWYPSKWIWFYSWINVVIFIYVMYLIVKNNFCVNKIKE